MRKIKFGAEQALAASHLAGVNYVVVASEMKQSVKDKDLDFGGERMVLVNGLAKCGGNAYGQIAGDFFRANAFRREGEDVGGFVLAAELTIEFAECRVSSEQDGDLTAKANGFLRSREKARQSAGGGQMEIFIGDERPLRRSCLRRGVGFQVWVQKDHRAQAAVCADSII